MNKRNNKNFANASTTSGGNNSISNRLSSYQQSMPTYTPMSTQGPKQSQSQRLRGQGTEQGQGGSEQGQSQGQGQGRYAQSQPLSMSMQMPQSTSNNMLMSNMAMSNMPVSQGGKRFQGKSLSEHLSS